MKRKIIAILSVATLFISTLNGCGNSDAMNEQVAKMQEEIDKQASEMQEEINKQASEMLDELNKQEESTLDENTIDETEDETDTAQEQNDIKLSESENTEENESTENNVNSNIENKQSPKANIENIIRDHIVDLYSNTDIDSITINDNLGTEIDGDFIALVYLTWNVNNSAETSKEVLELYSDDLAATIADSCPDVQELAIFWTVPYLNNANAKCSYERKEEKMYVMDNVWTGFN